MSLFSLRLLTKPLSQKQLETFAEGFEHPKRTERCCQHTRFQIHRGPAMEVHIKDVMLKELPEGGVIDFSTHPIPSDAQIIEAKAPKKKAKGK